MEPVIEEGHEWLVHHMVIYACHVTKDQLPVNVTLQDLHGRGSLCYTADQMNMIYHNCPEIMATWAVGTEV